MDWQAGDYCQSAVVPKKCAFSGDGYRHNLDGEHKFA
jgi:hypothetical protein